MLMDFCFNKEYYAKIEKVKQKTMAKAIKDINNFKLVFLLILKTQNVNF